MTNVPTTVYIVDDDPSACAACTFLLDTLGYACQSWLDGKSFVAQAGLHRKGVVLLDMRMPGMDGVAVHAHLNKVGSTLAVIILTGHADVAMASVAFKTGAVDFLQKPVSAQSLVPALDAAARASEEKLALYLIKRTFSALTAGEKAVARLVFEGHTNKVIADRLGMSVRYVEVQRAQAMEKFCVDNMAQFIQKLSILFLPRP